MCRQIGIYIVRGPSGPYVGRSVNVRYRPRQHLCRAARGRCRCRALQADYDTHGAEAFDHQVSAYLLSDVETVILQRLKPTYNVDYRSYPPTEWREYADRWAREDRRDNPDLQNVVVRDHELISAEKKAAGSKVGWSRS